MTVAEMVGFRSRYRSLAIGAYPSVRPRLLRPEPEREDLAAYQRARGAGYGVGGWALIGAVESAGLRGRGGAAFPTGVKLRSVAERGGPRYVVANGEEGEPASVKDRWLMRQRPHLVLDGLLCAGEAIDAAGSYVYVSDAESADSMERALAERGGLGFPTTVVRVEPGYVAGEETAVVRAIDGGPAKPLDKPPRPFECGVGQCPTLVCNVETLANIAVIAAGPEAFGRVGEGRQEAGTFLLTASGVGVCPGLYELPFGVPLGQALRLVAGTRGQPCGYLMGGFFAGIFGPWAADWRLGYEELRAEGSGLGCGAVVVLGEQDCPVAAAADVMAYFARENARQCGACIRGTAAMSGVLASVCVGSADDAQLAKLQKWSTSLVGRGACATLDGAANLAGSLLREFPDEIAAHLQRPCPRCVAHPVDSERTRFTVGAALDPVTIHS